MDEDFPTLIKAYLADSEQRYAEMERAVARAAAGTTDVGRQTGPVRPIRPGSRGERGSRPGRPRCAGGTTA